MNPVSHAPRARTRLAGCLVAVFMVTVAVRARAADTIPISDFTSPNVTAFGGAWTWAQTAPRTLFVGAANTSTDFLQQASIYPAIDVASGTSLRITGSWNPLGASGSFILKLLNNGATITTANFTFDQFASGPQTIYSSLTWSSTTTRIDQWQLIGNGNSSSAFGELELTEMSVVAGVPEPSTYAMALAGLACGAFAMRRRKKAA